MQAAREAELLVQATKHDEESTRKAVIERLAYLEAQAASTSKVKLAATALPPTPSSLVVKGAGTSRGKGTNIKVAASMKGSDNKKANLQAVGDQSTKKVPKSNDKLTRQNIEIIRATLETPTPRGRGPNEVSMLM